MTFLRTVEAIRRAEQKIVEDGRSEKELMLLAGSGVGDHILNRYLGLPGTAVVLAGPGKNGGDGLIAGLTLQEQGWQVFVWGYERRDAADLPLAEDQTEDFHWVDDLSVLETICESADVIIDGLFGIGARDELPQDVRKAISIAQSARTHFGSPIVSVDVPTGCYSDEGNVAEGAIIADLTVSIGAPKIGLYRSPALRHTGIIEVLDIGLDESAFPEDESPRLIDQSYVRASLPRRANDAWKRQAGTVLVVGGAPTYYGAPRLSATSALRSGAGLVGLAVPSTLISSISGAIPEAIFVPLPSGDSDSVARKMAQTVRDACSDYDALLIGPGLGRQKPVPQFLSGLFFGTSNDSPIGFGGHHGDDNLSGDVFRGRAVVDADALNWLSTQDGWHEKLNDAELVLTPHPGELARLLDATVEDITLDGWGKAREAAKKFNQVVVLKYGHTIVACPDGYLMVAPQVLPSQAAAGTGDVLSGIIATFLSQGMTARDAAACGLFIGTQATLQAQERSGTLSLIASDIIEDLPHALAALYDPAW